MEQNTKKGHTANTNGVLHEKKGEMQHETSHNHEMEERVPKPIFALLAVAVIILVFNQIQLSAITNMTGMAVSGDMELTGDLTQDAMTIVISRGLPDTYGAELGVTFDDPVTSMEVMASMDPTYGPNKIQLTGEELGRYVKVGSMIACEYCCGAKTLVFGNGQAACGCKHSWAMRGLAAYLIKYHGIEYNDEQILRELARWKGLFFPKQMITKLTEQLGSGQYTPDIAAMLLDVDEKTLEKLGSSSPPTSLAEMPSMVGGC